MAEKLARFFDTGSDIRFFKTASIKKSTMNYVKSIEDKGYKVEKTLYPDGKYSLKICKLYAKEPLFNGVVKNLTEALARIEGQLQGGR